MSSFEDGYKFFIENAGAYIGADKAADYVGDVQIEIDKLVKDLNAFEGFKTSSKMLKGDIAEFWHADTFNIKAVVEGSKNRTWVDRSHDFASTDISSNFGDRYGLKFYSSGQASAKAQATSIFQRFSEYKATGGKDSLEQFLADRGYKDFDKILNDPIYSGQIRIIPRDQLEEAAAWLQRMINTESARRPEQVERYRETLSLLNDRLKSNDGIESIPLSKEEAEALATLSKDGKIDADKLGLTPEELIKFENIMKQSFKAGMTAATIMYDGEQVEVTLRCDNSLMKTMIDRFGEDVTTLAYDMESFRLVTTISASQTFYGWIFGFGGKVQILEPESVKDKYRQMILRANDELLN